MANVAAHIHRRTGGMHAQPVAVITRLKTLAGRTVCGADSASVQTLIVPALLAAAALMCLVLVLPMGMPLDTHPQMSEREKDARRVALIVLPVTSAGLLTCSLILLAP
jgi:hypothetical protein